MENLIWAILLWLLVFILIPLDRIKEIWPAAVISMVLGFLINFAFVQWGYWRFTHYFALIAGVPPLHVAGLSLTVWLSIMLQGYLQLYNTRRCHQYQ